MCFRAPVAPPLAPANLATGGSRHPRNLALPAGLAARPVGIMTSAGSVTLTFRSLEGIDGRLAGIPPVTVTWKRASCVAS